MRQIIGIGLFVLVACGAPQARRITLDSSPESVEVVMGKPDRQYIRKTPEGELRIWSWVMNDPRGEPQPTHYTASNEAWPPPYYHFGVETTRVAFKDGKVFSIDSLRKWDGTYGRQNPGPVQPGFSKAEVRRALGGATRIYDRRGRDGDFEVWAYIVNEPREAPTTGKRVGFEGGVFIEPDYYYGVESLRVLFRDGKVASLERPDLASARRP